MFRTLVLAIGVTVALTACTSSPGEPSHQSLLTGRVNDAAGDPVNRPVIRSGALVTPVVPTMPDLSSAVVEVSGDALTATISFAPGTLSHTDTFACVMLDVDENSQTGVSSGSGDALGYDYSVCGLLPRGSTGGYVSRLENPSAVGVGTAQVTFPSADVMQITAPLSLLGNDDGRMAFKVTSAQWVVDTEVWNSGVMDVMPDLGLPAGLTR